MTAEYGKAIAFDYSYRHFYNDGYGKDFHILNLMEDTTGEHTDKLLLANMLSFYEQQLVFKRESDALRRYNLDKPLWGIHWQKRQRCPYRRRPTTKRRSHSSPVPAQIPARQDMGYTGDSPTTRRPVRSA